MKYNDHCWHYFGPNTGPDRSEQCSHCGIVYDPTKRVPWPGHGIYAPDVMVPPKPAGPCPAPTKEKKTA